MKKEWSILQILQHSRHDWLNVIQLIKGNLALGRSDRVEEIIEAVVYRSNHESKLSNLNIPKFAAELLVFNWDCSNYFRLDFEVIGEIKNLEKYDDVFSQWFSKFKAALNESCDQFADNHLQLTIKLAKNNYSYCTFDFCGKLITEAIIKDFVQNSKSYTKEIMETELCLANGEFHMVIRLK